MSPQHLVPLSPYMADALHRAAEIADRPVYDFPALSAAHEPSVDAIVEAALAELSQAAPDGSGTPEAAERVAAAFRDAATEAHRLAAERGLKGEDAREFVSRLALGAGRLLSAAADARGYGSRGAWDLTKAAAPAWHARVAELRSADNLTRARAH